MLRTFARILGLAALAVAMVAGVIDGARGLADGAPGLTSLGMTGHWLFPRQFSAIETAVVQHVHPLLMNLLALPTLPVMFVLGTALLIGGRPKQVPIAAPE
jgi:urea transporter